MLINTKYSIGDKVYFRCTDNDFNPVVRDAVVVEINIKSDNTIIYIVDCDVYVGAIELEEKEVFDNRKEAENNYCY